MKEIGRSLVRQLKKSEKDFLESLMAGNENKVFLDSSVLIAALLSSSGGSFYILNEFRGKFEFQINEYVFEETTRVLDEKFRCRGDLKSRLFLLLGWAGVKILPQPPKNKIRTLKAILPKEDAPILASALENSSYLLTLDSDFLNPIVAEFSKDQGLVILKPKEFISGLGLR